MMAIFGFTSAFGGVDTPTTDGNAHCLNSSAAVPATIARVTDGDTVVLTDGRRVRLIGINTLELNSKAPADKQWALAAKLELEKQIQSKQVFLVAGFEEFDRHGRTLAHLKLGDGSSAAEALIRQGFGLSIAVGVNQRCALQYEHSETQARQAKRGIWENPGHWFNEEQQLTGRERGFLLAISTVLKAQKVKQRNTLELKNGLRITLNEHFTKQQSAADTQNLLGKRIEVRGWLGKQSGRQNLTLSHPTNLRVLQY